MNTRRDTKLCLSAVAIGLLVTIDENQVELTLVLRHGLYLLSHATARAFLERRPRSSLFELLRITNRLHVVLLHRAPHDLDAWREHVFLRMNEQRAYKLQSESSFGLSNSEAKAECRNH